MTKVVQSSTSIKLLQAGTAYYKVLIKQRDLSVNRPVLGATTILQGVISNNASYVVTRNSQ